MSSKALLSEAPIADSRKLTADSHFHRRFPMTNSASGIARHWRLKAQRYSLAGQACPDCNTVSFPPRNICPACSEASDHIFQFDTPVKKAAAPTPVNFPLPTAEKQLEPIAA
jgi:uncharacterized OB-fold protein